MLSRSGEYALQAVVFLARSNGEALVPGSAIARQTGIPRKYLSKILADLSRCGVLTATRGKSGGFRLARPAYQIALAEVVAPFEAIVSGRNNRCPFGNEVCSEVNPCVGHARWSKVKEAYLQFLARTSVQDVAIERHAAARAGDRGKPRQKGPADA